MSDYYSPLEASKRALNYQRDWAKSLRQRISDGEQFAFVNADTPHEIFHAMGIPVVVNQWWSSVISAKQLSPHYLDRAVDMGFHDKLAKYSALPLIAALEGDEEKQPWGGLPDPTFLCARQSADDHQRIFQLWAEQSGAELHLLNAPAPDANLMDWWIRARDDWEEFYGSARLDLMQSQIETMIAAVEDASGRDFDRSNFALYMEKIEEQALVCEQVSLMISQAPRCPVRISEQIPNVMIPQWHRGSTWAIEHVKLFRDEIQTRIENGQSVCENENVRMMWIGAGLWFDTDFYTDFEEQFGAVFAWSMYLPFAADGYIRHSKGNPIRALAARVVSMNEQLHQPPWANRWLAKQAKDYRIDVAVMLIPENDRPSGYGCRFIAQELRNAGVVVVEITADMVDARRWDKVKARQAVVAGIEQSLCN